MKKKGKKLSALIVLMLIINYVLTSNILADLATFNDNVNDIIPRDTLVQEQEKNNVHIKYELKDKREKNLKYFLKSNSTYEVVTYPQAVHYLKNGKFVDIDNSLYESTDDKGKGILKNKENIYSVQIAKKSDAKKLVEIKKGQYDLSWAIQNISKGTDIVYSEKEKSDEYDKLSEDMKKVTLPKVSSEVMFESIFEGVDLQYLIQSEKIKENIILHEKKDNFSISFIYKSKTLFPVIQEDNSIIFFDKEKHVKDVFRIPPLFMYDDKNILSKDIEVTMENSKDSEYIITLTPNNEWLNDASRAYPVVIDPPMEVRADYRDIIDATIQNQDITSVNNDSPIVQIGTLQNVDFKKIYRTLVKAELPNIVDLGEILEATYKMSISQINSDASNVDVHQITSDWTATTVSWDNHPSYNSVNFVRESIADLVTNPSWNITSIVQDWYATGNNFGLLFKDDTEELVPDIFKYNEFYSANSTSSMTPYLSITYVPSGDPSESSTSTETSIQITVDGNTDDWASITPLITSSNSTGPQSLKAYADSTYIYMLVEGMGLDANYDFFLNTDNNNQTGYDYYDMADTGIEYLAERGGHLYTVSGDNSWPSTYVASIDSFESSSVREVRILKSYITNLASTISIGYIDMNADWDVVAQLPASGGTMASFNLNEVVEPTPTPAPTQTQTPTPTQTPTSTSAITPSPTPVATSTPVAVNIIIDGNTSDWNSIDPIVTSNPLSGLTSLKIKETTDKFYFLAEGNNIGVNYDLFLNTDNNASTGYKFWNFSNGGIDFMIETGGELYQSLDGGWPSTYVGSAGINAFNNSNVIEIEVPKSSLGSLSDTITMGIIDMNETWDRQSQLPESGNMVEYTNVPIPTPTTTEVQTIEKLVTSGNDDVEERSDGSYYGTSSDLEITKDGTAEQIIGLRFTDIQIPKGAIITNAYVQFTAKTANTDIMNPLLISGIAEDNASAFPETTNSVSGKSTTANNVSWIPEPWISVYGSGVAERTSNIKDIVQEIINRDGWSQGNAIALKIEGTSSAYRRAYSYNGSASKAPKLVVEYFQSNDGYIYNISGELNDIRIIDFNLNQVEDKYNKTYKINFDSESIEAIDYCAKTYHRDDLTGNVEGTNIFIESILDNSFTFRLLNTGNIDDDFNSIKFRLKKSGSSIIKLSIN
jgi:hypothetical protein